MTRRERLEARAERRREWAAKAEARSEAALGAARVVADGIPLGQPILRGHHSEGRHRRDLARIDAGMRRGIEAQKAAAEHSGAADEIEQALERSIYADDPGAAEALEARAAAHEAAADRLAALNKAWRKGGAAALAAAGATAREIEHAASTVSLCPWLCKAPLSAASERAAARRDREKAREILARAARAAKAAAAGGILIASDGIYATVTFAEAPAREVLAALKAAGYHWSGGAWHGRRAALPPEIAPPSIAQEGGSS